MNDAELGDAGVLDAPNTMRRRMWRNFVLKGGWAVFVAFLLNLVLSLLKSWRNRAIDVGVYTWGLGLAVLLFAPVGLSYWGRQWLIVPGGLILRRAGWRESGWRVHVFDRRASVLITYNHHRAQWGFVVADSRECETAIGTFEEVAFATRAYLSPLPPPPEDRLSDLRS